MDLFAFIHALDPTKVRVVEREREVDKPRLLDITIGSTVPVLLVAPNRADNELEASVEWLFDEGGSGTQTEQGDSTRGRPDTEIQLVVRAMDTIAEEAAPVRSRRLGKRKSMVVYAGGASHPPKKLREDHGTPSGTFVSGKSGSSLQRSSTPVMTTAAAVTSMVDSTLVAKEKTVKPSLFSTDSSSAEKRRLKYVVEEKDELHEARDEKIENLKAQMLWKEAEAAKAIPLRAEASNFETVKKSLRDEVNALKEHNALTSVKSQNDALVDRVHELELSSSGLQEKVTVYENYMEQLKKFQDDRMKATNLISCVELAITIYLNSPKYLSALGAAIGKSIEKGTEGTSDVVPATADTTTALSTTFASASTIAPISVDDYEVMGTDDQEDADGNADPFPNIDDAELNIPQ
uniref:Uncharacterized protein n=1 Tax=Tanacetum cinerariifolium TaxID=118510 RepID=A0A6L2JTF2_TANCI|nr:hypothetical protein [Tanacetum cinerariifolium]